MPSYLSDISTESVSWRRLTGLRNRLSQLMVSWTVKDYHSFLMFFVRILPRLFEAERCTIFIIEPGTEKICSMFGTGIDGKKIEPPRKGSVVGEVITSGQGVVINDLDSRPGFHIQVDEMTDFHARNMVCVPIEHMTVHGAVGAIQIINKNSEGGFDNSDLEFLQEVTKYLSTSIESIIVNQEILRLSRQLNTEVSELDRHLVKKSMLIAESKAMREIVSLANEISNSPVNVLLQGENGTGKELIARLIHELSDRRDKPFIAVNCSAIPENLMESEFFGFEKGAFTGAEKNTIGRFEAAEGGTLFLDEIAELPLNLQPKFLRALEESEGSRLGSSKVLSYDFRVISATNKDLTTEKENGRFREDLFFRLFSIEIDIPPLRDRPEDILPMATTFLKEINKHFNKSVFGFTQEVLAIFENYNWPGNVRQLKREIERMVALTQNGAMIQQGKCSRELQSFRESGAPDTLEHSRDLASYSLPDTLRKVETKLIRKALGKTKGNKSRAATLLGITRQGLLKKMKRLHLEKRDPNNSPPESVR